MVKCIVVDDERAILNELCDLISQCDIDIKGAYQDPQKAFDEIEDTRPDIAFLDIEMPEINGIELAKKLSEKDIHTIFITAYKEHAVNAFGVGAVHYLLKPVKKADIAHAVERAKELVVMKRGLGQVTSFAFVKNVIGLPEKISLKDNDDITIIKLSDILYISSQDGVTMITTIRGSYIARKGLVHWEEHLKELGFVRCHKSYIVNTDYIVRMIHIIGEYRELELSYGDVRIPISRRKVADVKHWLGIG